MINYSRLTKYPEKFVLLLHKKYGITPDILTYIRIFSAPWLALLISRILSSRSLTLAIFTLLIYFLVISTDFLDGILARAISKTTNHDHISGAVLDRLADKILIILVLIPFGLNLFTFLIILAESILVFQVLNSPDHKKQANRAGKIKMVLQTLLIPILILNVVTNFIPEMLIYIYIIITIVSTYTSIYSHYFYFSFEND